MRTRLFAAFGALALGACVQILGDDFEVTGATGTVGAGGDAAGGGVGGGVGGGDGGTGGSVGGAGAGGGGMGGGGGTVGPGCDPYAFGLCGANRKCSVVNFATGDTDCITTTSRPAWSRCDDDGECAEGTFCSPLYGTCKPLCSANEDCPTGEKGEAPICTVAWLEVNGVEIPGIQLCVANCNPATRVPCQTPGATCNLTTVAPSQGGFECVGAGVIGEGGPCQGEPADDKRVDCVAGHGCFGNPVTQMGECYRWCEPIGSQGNCDAGDLCTQAGAGSTYGTCPH